MHFQQPVHERRNVANDCVRLLHNSHLKRQSCSNLFHTDCILWALDFHLATNFIAEMDTAGFEVKTIKQKNKQKNNNETQRERESGQKVKQLNKQKAHK